jgi:hypothetical protein
MTTTRAQLTDVMKQQGHANMRLWRATMAIRARLIIVLHQRVGASLCQETAMMEILARTMSVTRALVVRTSPPQVAAVQRAQEMRTATTTIRAQQIPALVVNASMQNRPATMAIRARLTRAILQQVNASSSRKVAMTTTSAP